jgi:hypothetical protein
MRELRIGEQTVRVRATPLALLFYRQEFGSDLLGDLAKMQLVVKDPSQLDTVAILRLVWSMAKAEAFGKQFPSFVDWLAALDGFDFSDVDLLQAVMQEAQSGFLSKAAARNARA